MKGFDSMGVFNDLRVFNGLDASKEGQNWRIDLRGADGLKPRGALNGLPNSDTGKR